MKSLWNICPHRPDISLLAAGAVDGEAKRELERHLASCRECREYFNETKALTAPLTDWEKPLTPVEATASARMRWARAVKAAGAQDADDEPVSKNIWGTIWRELIWPSRRAWAGMAAVWLAMLIVNGKLSDHQATETSSAAVASGMQAWQEQNRVLAEVIQPGIGVPTVRAIIPGPRSEWQRLWKRV